MRSDIFFSMYAKVSDAIRLLTKACVQLGVCK